MHSGTQSWQIAALGTDQHYWFPDTCSLKECFLDEGSKPGAAQVHRHHPPLVYGRGSLGLAPEFSEGAAVCAVPQGPTGQPTYAVVTYRREACRSRFVKVALG